MWLLAGAPYYEPAKEREGAPSLFPRCSCPFFIIFPSIFVAALIDAICYMQANKLPQYVLEAVMANLGHIFADDRQWDDFF
jgi:hypothetical protein